MTLNTKYKLKYIILEYGAEPKKNFQMWNSDVPLTKFH